VVQFAAMAFCAAARLTLPLQTARLSAQIVEPMSCWVTAGSMLPGVHRWSGSLPPSPAWQAR
jgi:hypothetical protein